MSTLPVYKLEQEQYDRILAAFDGDREILKDWIHNTVIEYVLNVEAQRERERIEADLNKSIATGRDDLGFKPLVVGPPPEPTIEEEVNDESQ